MRSNSAQISVNIKEAPMASKVSIIGIVAWGLVAVLAIGAGALGFLFQK